MQVFSNHRFSVDLPPGHRFPMPKYQLLRDRVEAECSGLAVTEAPPASEGELALVHTPDYIAAVLQGTLGAAAQREIGFPWSERMVACSLRSVGATIASGVLLGVLVSLSSIGAGAVGATLILLLYPRLPAHRLVGTDIAHAVPLTLVAGIGHATLGHVDWSLLVWLLMGSLPGIWLGAQLTKTMPERAVRALLCVSLVAAGLKVIH